MARSKIVSHWTPVSNGVLSLRPPDCADAPPCLFGQVEARSEQKKQSYSVYRAASWMKPGSPRL